MKSKIGDVSRTTVISGLCAVMLWMTSACGYAMTAADDEAILRERVLKYLSHFEQREYGKMWEMSSTRLRDANENDKDEFVRYAQKHNLPEMKTTLVALEVNGRTAKAKVELNFWIAEESVWESETEVQIWVKEKNTWLIDSSKSADPGDGR